MSSTGLLLSQTKLWSAPASADTIKNSLKGNPTSVDDGKKLYVQYCVMCHGDKGKGDGPAGISLTPRPADHSSAKVQKQTDGAIFWKLTTGNPPMASYESILTKDQRWQLVNYIRTFKKPEKEGKDKAEAKK